MRYVTFDLLVYCTALVPFSLVYVSSISIVYFFFSSTALLDQLSLLAVQCN